MYSTCLFCHSALGRNESLEPFPVGRRLAYDASKGRLWVVCTKCERWNLSPLEERWEAIEAAERAYRDTKKRVATDNIGLARLRDGTDLIRIGAPLRPEFAAWRYGGTFGRRYRKRLILGGSAAMLGAGLAAAVVTGSGGLFANVSMGVTVLNSANAIWSEFARRRTRLTINANDGVRLRITRADLRGMVMSVGDPNAEGPWSEPTLYFIRSGKERKPVKKEHRNPDGTVWKYDDSSETIHGSEALTSLTRILAATNSLSGAPRHVTSAVSLLEAADSSRGLLHSLSRHVRKPLRPWERMPHSSAILLWNLTTPARLALEMSLHEADERRAMEGDLLDLEKRWKEAEEIAGIADSLTLPDSALSKLADYKAKSRTTEPDSPSRSD